MIIDWPGVVKMGSRFDLPVISTDLYPTLLEMAALPSMPKQHVDGLSLVPSLKGGGKPQGPPPARSRPGQVARATVVDKNDIRHRPLFWHYPHYGDGGGPASAVLLEQWKLIECWQC
jgi:arylsulfatase A-like enzyme